MELLYKISIILMGSLNVTEIFQNIIDYVFGLLKRIDRAAVLLIDERTDELKQEFYECLSLLVGMSIMFYFCLMWVILLPLMVKYRKGYTDHLCNICIRPTIYSFRHPKLIHPAKQYLNDLMVVFLDCATPLQVLKNMGTNQRGLS